jgi:hypothetical protein
MSRAAAGHIVVVASGPSGSREDAMAEHQVEISFSSPSVFAIAEMPSQSELEAEGRVRYLVVSGVQDDGLWGPVGTAWLSEDGRRGGFLVNPSALWEGSEIVRGYRSALRRGWTHERIYSYWKREVWRGSYAVDEEHDAGTLVLLSELISVL